MGIILNAIERRETALTADDPRWLLDLLGGGTTAHTGASITEATAIYSSAVFACVRILAETIGTLPLIIYERRGRMKERATKHRLYSLLHDAPNPEMTRAEMWEAMVGHLVLRGNAYANIGWDKGMRPVALWPLRPDRMAVKRTDSGQIVYEYRVKAGDQPIRLAARDVLHLRGLGSNGIVGYSPITLAREAIGLSLAAEEYGARFFANDSRPGGILSVQKKLNPEAAERLKTGWEAAHKGMSQGHRVAVLEEGVTWQQVGVAPDDAQYLETRQFQVTEIARMFRIPPHMIGDLSHATFSNIEHQGIEFLTHTLRPWLVKIEQRVNQQLFSPSERDRYFAEHLVDGLLRGDIGSRYTAYATARQNGWMSANDIRALENQNPIQDGDIYLVPLNMVPADQAGIRAMDPAEERRDSGIADTGHGAVERRATGAGSAEGRRRTARAYRRLVEDATGRVLKREQADIMRQAEKLLARGDVAGFITFLETFYKEHPAFYAQYMGPVLNSLAEQIAADAFAEISSERVFDEAMERFVQDYTSTAASKYCYSNMGQLRQLVRDTEAGDAQVEALRARFDEWREQTPGKQAMIQTVRCQNAITREAWMSEGVVELEWQTHGKSCPWCNHLNGRVVRIQDAFVTKDQEVFAEGGVTGAINESLRPGSDIHHPPLHLGCDCGLRPVI